MRDQFRARRVLTVRTSLFSIFALLGIGLAGCQPVADAAEAGPPELANGFASPGALGKAVLEALAGDDQSTLRALRVTREEWLELFWPELPESRNTPFDFAWQMKNDNSREAERAILSEFGGQEFELLGIRFTEAPEVYPNFTLHFGAELRARRVADGQEGILPILSVVVERQGLWKLSNYVD
jgi:hypothetical protein